jgi:hypothetical protein
VRAGKLDKTITIERYTEVVARAVRWSGSVALSSPQRRATKKERQNFEVLQIPFAGEPSEETNPMNRHQRRAAEAMSRHTGRPDVAQLIEADGSVTRVRSS